MENAVEAAVAVRDGGAPGGNSINIPSAVTATSETGGCGGGVKVTQTVEESSEEQSARRSRRKETVPQRWAKSTKSRKIRMHTGQIIYKGYPTTDMEQERSALG